jgi:hypothetical protein
MDAGYTAEVPRRPHAARLLRLPPELEREIAALAAREYRTFTAQVVKMLTEWLAAHPEARGQGESTGGGARELPRVAEEGEPYRPDG